MTPTSPDVPPRRSKAVATLAVVMLAAAVAQGYGRFTYGVVLGMGYTWEAALGAVFLSGVTFFLLSIFRIREWIINSIPITLRLGIAAGIGLFLAMVAMKNAGIIVDNPATLVSVGDLSEPAPLYALAGFFVITALAHLRVTGAVMIGILGVTLVLGFAIGLIQALTSVQEMTLTFVPKIVAVVVVFFLSIGYMTRVCLDLFNNTIIPLILG